MQEWKYWKPTQMPPTVCVRGWLHAWLSERDRCTEMLLWSGLGLGGENLFFKGAEKNGGRNKIELCSSHFDNQAVRRAWQECNLPRFLIVCAFFRRTTQRAVIVLFSYFHFAFLIVTFLLSGHNRGLSEMFVTSATQEMRISKSFPAAHRLTSNGASYEKWYLNIFQCVQEMIRHCKSLSVYMFMYQF